jgi:hypothetical protein
MRAVDSRYCRLLVGHVTGYTERLWMMVWTLWLPSADKVETAEA